MPDAPAPSLADVFAAVAALARVLTGGRPLTELRLVYADDRGREGSIPVPFDVPDGAAPSGHDATPKAVRPMTATEKAILRTLQESDEPMTRKEVAGRLGHEHHRGRFGQAFGPMVDDGRIYEIDGEYADVPEKFTDTG